MQNEEIIRKVEDVLKAMGCTEIEFPDPKSDLIVAVFNCKEITSFIATIPGWTFSGIHLDPTKKHQYKIDFTKLN